MTKMMPRCFSPPNHGQQDEVLPPCDLPGPRPRNQLITDASVGGGDQDSCVLTELWDTQCRLGKTCPTQAWVSPAFPRWGWVSSVVSGSLKLSSHPFSTPSLTTSCPKESTRVYTHQCPDPATQGWLVSGCLAGRVPAALKPAWHSGAHRTVGRSSGQTVWEVMIRPTFSWCSETFPRPDRPRS